MFGINNMNRSCLVSAGYLPCMSKSTCTTTIKKIITLPTLDIGNFTTTSDLDYSTSDESNPSDTSGDESNTPTHTKERRMKYSDIADDIAKYVSNIKGI